MLDKPCILDSSTAGTASYWQPMDFTCSMSCRMATQMPCIQPAGIVNSWPVNGLLPWVVKLRHWCVSLDGVSGGIQSSLLDWWPSATCIADIAFAKTPDHVRASSPGIYKCNELTVEHFACSLVSNQDYVPLNIAMAGHQEHMLYTYNHHARYHEPQRVVVNQVFNVF